MATVPNESSDTPSDVHLPWFWTLWRRNLMWRDGLAKRAAHKALDIPEDDMQINANKYGVGPLGLGIAALGPVVGAVAAYALLKPPTAPSAPTPTPAAASPLDSEYEVLFYDKDGNKISVPHISTKPAG